MLGYAPLSAGSLRRHEALAGDDEISDNMTSSLVCTDGSDVEVSTSSKGTEWIRTTPLPTALVTLDLGVGHSIFWALSFKFYLRFDSRVLLCSSTVGATFDANMCQHKQMLLDYLSEKHHEVDGGSDSFLRSKFATDSVQPISTCVHTAQCSCRIRCCLTETCRTPTITERKMEQILRRQIELKLEQQQKHKRSPNQALQVEHQNGRNLVHRKTLTHNHRKWTV